MYRLTPEATKSRMKMLIYGPQGAGKTFLAAQAQDHPDMAPVLVLNIEGGLMSIASRGDIDVEDIDSTAKLEEVFWKLKNKDPDFAKYKTVIIDSVTELQTMNLSEVAESNQGANKGIDDFSQRDYGKSTNMLKRALRWYRDLPINVIVTALPKRMYDKTTKKGEEAVTTEVRPSLTDKLCDAVMGYMDFVWYYWPDNGDATAVEDSKVRRRLLTHDHGVYRAKTRGQHFAAALGAVVDNPTMPQLYDLYVKSEVVQPKSKKESK